MLRSSSSAVPAVVTGEGAAALQAVVPSAELADVEGARHMVPGDHNDLFMIAVVDFLLRTAPADGAVEREGASPG